MPILNRKIGAALLVIIASTASATANNEHKKRHLRKGNNRTAKKDNTMQTILANDITEDVAFWTRSLQSSMPPDPTPPPTPPVRPITPSPTMSVPVPSPITPFPSSLQATPQPTDQVATPQPTDQVATPQPTDQVATPQPTDQVATPQPTESPVPAPSNSPVARDDAVIIGSGDLAFISVLDNDTPAAGQTLQVVSIVTQATNGDCSISLDILEVVYLPNDGFTGTDSCVYEACDRSSPPACDTATVTITVV